MSHVIQCEGRCLSTIDGLFGTGISDEKRFYLFSNLDGVSAGYTIMILLYICAGKTVTQFDHIQYVDYIGLFEHYTTICVAKWALKLHKAISPIFLQREDHQMTVIMISLTLI